MTPATSPASASRRDPSALTGPGQRNEDPAKVAERKARYIPPEQRTPGGPSVRWPEGIGPPSGDETSPTAPAPTGGPSPSVNKSKGSGGTVAGLFLGAFAYFLGLAFLRGGPTGAKNWMAAKFLNKPAGTLTSAPLQ